jgi:YVTN family beta-propeller protein
VVSTSTDQIVATIPVGPYVYAVALNPAGTYAYVADSGGYTNSEVSVISTPTNTVVSQIPLPQLSDPMRIMVNNSGTIVYALDDNSSSISVIDATTNLLYTTFSVVKKSYPLSFAFDSSPSLAKIPTNITVRFAPGRSALSVADEESLYWLAWSLLPSSHVSVATYAYHDLNLTKVRANSIVVYTLRFARFHPNFERIITAKKDIGVVSDS